MTTRTCLLLLLTLVAASACSNSEAPSWTFGDWARTAADTSRITADRLGSCTAPGQVTETYESAELSYVLDAKILPDGRVAVADALKHFVLIFSRQAAPRQFGRQGGGPGEFQNLRGLFLVGDTLLAWDQRARRVTAFSPNGDLFWTQRLESDGSFSGRTGSGYYPLLASASSSVGIEGPFRDTTVLLVARPDSGAVLVARFPSSHQFSAREGAGWRSYPQIFSPDIYMTVAGQGAWIGDSSTGELVSVGPRGETTRLLLIEVAPRRPTPEMIEAERRTMASNGRGTALTTMAEKVPALTVLPAFKVLRGSSDGRIIMGEYSPASDKEYRTWLIDPVGLGVRCVTISIRAKVLDARGNVVLVVTRDEMDVPRLELRSIDPTR